MTTHSRAIPLPRIEGVQIGSIYPPVEKERPRLRIQVVLHKEDVGGYSVSVPALPGCFSQGETEEEAVANIQEAIEGCLSIGLAHIKLSSDNDIVREIEL